MKNGITLRENYKCAHVCRPTALLSTCTGTNPYRPRHTNAPCGGMPLHTSSGGAGAGGREDALQLAARLKRQGLAHGLASFSRATPFEEQREAACTASTHVAAMARERSGERGVKK